jgi:hypothetical protein
MSEEREKVFDEVKPEPVNRNENLTGGKSTQCHTEEAKQEKDLHKKQKLSIADSQPEEVKATAELLPEDAEMKSHSDDESVGS